VYIHKKEENWLLDPALNGSNYFMMGAPIHVKPADYFFDKEEKHTIGDFTFDVFETPGHSPGSVSFYFENLELVASGDALFKNSIGRTDLPGGSERVLLESIHKKLMVLPENTLVLPGHGPVTTIEDEMTTNPFINGY
jgi:glyoxylase-like metal-dependent hydrolase (beta-lactamase superfamily II)